MSRKLSPWQRGGSDTRPERLSLAHALRAAYEAERRAPTERERPPLSTLPGPKPVIHKGQLQL